MLFVAFNLCKYIRQPPKNFSDTFPFLFLHNTSAHSFLTEAVLSGTTTVHSDQRPPPSPLPPEIPSVSEPSTRPKFQHKRYTASRYIPSAYPCADTSSIRSSNCNVNQHGIIKKSSFRKRDLCNDKNRQKCNPACRNCKPHIPAHPSS